MLYVLLVVAYVAVLKYMAEHAIETATADRQQGAPVLHSAKAGAAVAGGPRTADRRACRDLGEALPLIFMALMGVAMLAYVVLDGFDLGVGMLLPRAGDEHKDLMIASIGPFWDANETWLVLGVGILLIAFPKAHGIVLSALYLPVALMLIGLILRGVAFDFRVKARDQPQAAVEPCVLRRLDDRRAVARLDARPLHHRLCRRLAVLAVRGDDRVVPAGRLRAARRVLAGDEDRRRAAAHGGRMGEDARGRRWWSAWG